MVLDAEFQLSVIVATYNRGALLRENIEAVLAQDVDDFEIIYVDDGSTDDTWAILRDYAVQYPNRFRVLRKPNGGQGLARNLGAREARGALLLFTDDDTIPPADWVRRMRTAFEGVKADALSGGFAPVSMSSSLARYMYYREHMLFGDTPKYVRAAPMMNFLLSAKLFWELGGFIAEPIEDWVLCRELRARKRKIYYDPRIKVRHHYQCDRAQACRRVRTPAIRGIYDQLDRGGSGIAYMLYSLANFLSSPLWSLWRFPLDLYGVSLQMESLFFRARLQAYIAALLQVRLSTPH